MQHGLPKPTLYGLFLVGLFAGIHASAQTSDTLVLNKALSLQFPRRYAELIIAPNPVEAGFALGTWKPPKPGESIDFPDREKKEWRTISADNKGWFTDTISLRNGYVYVPVEMKQRRVMILEAMGNEMVYVNGTQRSGNPYGLSETRESWEPGFDYSKLPVMLEEGRNDFLFRCTRERLKIKLYAPRIPIMLNPRDLTIPDFLVGEQIDTWGAIVVMNATTRPLKDLSIRASLGTEEGVAVQIPPIQSLSVRKVGFRLRGQAPTLKGIISVRVSIGRMSAGKPEILDTVTIPFRALNREENHKETFISNIDGSVQYYAINPAGKNSSGRPAALFLSLHGAGVEAINQSDCTSRRHGHIVAPTNRRPYGFNWEDWGRTDALEVLETVKKRFAIDENRIYLTGHSMGGHGVWHIGSLLPDKFAAIGPSAGWISFWTYRFRGMDVIDTSAVRRMIRRSTCVSETFQHVRNYDQLGVYVLHGSDDDNVPVEQARSMVEQLGKTSKDFVYDEQKGVRHWWDLSNEPGADCVDWAPMFDFFARHSRPEKRPRARNTLPDIESWRVQPEQLADNRRTD